MILKRVCLVVIGLVALVQAAVALESTSVPDGCLLVEQGDYARAIPLLSAQLKTVPDDHRAELCLGIALSRQGEKGAALHLKRALFNNPEDPVVHLELGRYFFEQQIPEEAEDFFRDAVSLAPQSPAAKEATVYLRKINAVASPKAWKILVRGGIQYDSNVILNGEDQPLPAAYSGEADSSAVGTFKALYSPIIAPGRRVSLGYSLYQSLHAKLDDFDITQNLLEVSGEQAVTPNLVIRGLYTFEYLHLGGDAYDQSHRLSPEAQWKSERFGSTILRYALSSTRYKASSRFPDNPDRDGRNHQAAVTHYYPLAPSWLLFAGYMREAERVEVGKYSFDGNRGTVGTRVKLPVNCVADISAEHDLRSYRGRDPVFSKTRRDSRTTFSATLSKGLGKSMGLAAGVAYTQNFSNIDPYDYQRFLTSLFLTAEF